MRFHLPIILLAAALLRFLFLGSNPAGVFRDEAEKGYSAYCLLKIGGVFDFALPPAPRNPEKIRNDAASLPDHPADSYAPRLRPWPVFINVWGATTSMIYQYAALPFVAAGGLNAWTVRLPSALAGTLTVLLTFFLARVLTGRDSEALWAAAFLAFSPWHVVFSRWALQGIFVPLFTTAGTLAFVRALESRKPERGLWISALCFGLAFYSYSGARPFLLLYGLLLLVLWRKTLIERWKMSLRASALLLAALAPTLWNMFCGGGMGRFHRLSVFALDESAHVKALLFLQNYLAHFSPQFLFLTGDAEPRHGFLGFGEMLHVEALFLIAGLYTAFRRRAAADRLLLGWFLLFPVSAALTHEGVPHALRTLHAVPCPQILGAMGAVAVLEWLEKRWGTAARRAGIALWGLNAAALAAVLFLHYPRWSAPHFEYGVREAIRMAQTLRSETGSETENILHVQSGPGLPGVYELYYFHAAVPPRAVLERGLNAGRIRLYPSSVPPEAVLDRLRGNDALLVSSSDFPRLYGGLIRGRGFESRPILLPRAFFSNEPSEILRLVSRKPLGGKREQLEQPDTHRE